MWNIPYGSHWLLVLCYHHHKALNIFIIMLDGKPTYCKGQEKRIWITSSHACSKSSGNLTAMVMLSHLVIPQIFLLYMGSWTEFTADNYRNCCLHLHSHTDLPQHILKNVRHAKSTFYVLHLLAITCRCTLSVLIIVVLICLIRH